MMKQLALFLLLPFQLSLATKIFLSPEPKTRLTSVSPKLAGARLAQHLGLEIFEPSDSSSTYGEEVFVGQGIKKAILLSVNEADVDRIMPKTLKPALSVTSKAESLDGLISSYTHRAQHAYSNIITAAHTHSPSLYYVPENLRDQLDILLQFHDSTDASSFAAVQLDLTNADETSINIARTFVENALAQPSEVRLAVLTYTGAPAVAKRQQSPLPSQAPPPPVYSSCFDTADACSNGTNSCSGHGQCVESTKAGCFICACAASEEETWVGAKCERKDVSGPFVLIVGTVVVLLLVAYGSVSLLSSVGGQELPSTLMGGAVQAKRD